MRADRRLVHNIRQLLDVAGIEQRTLAETIGHSEAWLSKALKGGGENKRGIRVKDLDPIAAFFGLRVDQLFSETLPAASLRPRAARRRPGRRPRA